MKPVRPVYVVGGAITPFIGKFHPDFIWKKHPDFGTKENPSLEDYIVKSTNDALANCGVEAKDVDRGIIGNFVGELFNNQGHLGAMIGKAHPDLAYKAFHRVEGACASGGLAVVSAIEAIAAGADIVLVVGAEVQTTQNAIVGADYLARASHYETERSIDDFTFPCMFARRMKAYCEKYDISPDAVAPIVAKAYENAAKNPKAHMREVAMSVENASTVGPKNPLFLKNEDFCNHLRISDCSQVSDGGSAMILASAEGLAKIDKIASDCVQIKAYGLSTGPLGEVKDLTKLDVSASAIQKAYASAGWNPDDVQVAEVHDCFSITEALMYEAMGFCRPGEGVNFGAEGNTKIDGRIPVNTGGGLMAFGHPVGATGVKQILEIARQMKGECGDYQMANKPTRGACLNMGGDDRTAVATLIEAV